jgi:hypothetical protein
MSGDPILEGLEDNIEDEEMADTNTKQENTQ